jgi:4-hydroxy-2-oxoheptanedioate aldolase
MVHPPTNRSKLRLSAGEAIFGPFLGIPSATLVELCGIAGFDYVVIDCEHSAIDFGACEEMVRAAELAGITSIVRVPGHDPRKVLRYLDMGAQGIMAPNVVSVAEARALVDAARYAPVGSRGLGPGRAARYGFVDSLGDYARLANEEVLVVAQLENVQALVELDALVRVPGIDAFMLGTADLSASMGYPGERTRAEVLEVKERFVNAVLSAGRVLGDTADNPETAEALFRRGYRMLDCSFAQVAGKACGALVDAVRNATSHGGKS